MECVHGVLILNKEKIVILIYIIPILVYCVQSFYNQKVFFVNPPDCVSYLLSKILPLTDRFCYDWLIQQIIACNNGFGYISFSYVVPQRLKPLLVLLILPQRPTITVRLTSPKRYMDIEIKINVMFLGPTYVLIQPFPTRFFVLVWSDIIFKCFVV